MSYLFSLVYQVEHIIPYSRRLDDSYMNKTLCHVDVNKEKGNQTPHEAFAGDEERWVRLCFNVRSNFLILSLDVLLKMRSMRLMNL